MGLRNDNRFAHETLTEHTLRIERWLNHGPHASFDEARAERTNDYYDAPRSWECAPEGARPSSLALTAGCVGPQTSAPAGPDAHSHDCATPTR